MFALVVVFYLSNRTVPNPSGEEVGRWWRLKWDPHLAVGLSWRRRVIRELRCCMAGLRWKHTMVARETKHRWIWECLAYGTFEALWRRWVFLSSILSQSSKFKGFVYMEMELHVQLRKWEGTRVVPVSKPGKGPGIWKDVHLCVPSFEEETITIFTLQGMARTLVVTNKHF